jgi:tetratricopeptide (TPR) repeat protein
VDLVCAGAHRGALPYFDEAIQIKVSLRQERNQKSEAFTYWERAIASMYVGRLQDAAQDLQNAINLNPEEMYYLIWLHIVRSRLGVDDQPELAANVKDYDFSKWPGAIIALYLGQHDEAAVHNIALATEKETDRADNVCASELYGAIHQLAKGSQTEGRRLLQSAADHCAPGTFGRVAAGWELKRLEGLLPHWDDKSLVLANCDRLAASNLDPQRPASVPGVPVSALKASLAVPACEAALKFAPDEPRIIYQLGRAYGVAKEYEKARKLYERADAIGHALATNKRYPAAGGGRSRAPAGGRKQERIRVERASPRSGGVCPSTTLRWSPPPLRFHFAGEDGR